MWVLAGISGQCSVASVAARSQGRHLPFGHAAIFDEQHDRALEKKPPWGESGEILQPPGWGYFGVRGSPGTFPSDTCLSLKPRDTFSFESRLVTADYDTQMLEAGDRIFRQAALIAKLAAQGRNTAEATSELAALRNSLKVLSRHRKVQKRKSSITELEEEN